MNKISEFEKVRYEEQISLMQTGKADEEKWNYTKTAFY